MKNFKLFTFFALLSILVLSCNKDNEGTLEVEFLTTFKGQPVEMLREYPFQDGTIAFTMIQYYITNLEIEDKDGASKIVLKDVDLIDASSSKVIRKNLDAGAYRNLSIGLGLDEFWGNSEPSSFSSNHPLSLDQNNFWIMSQSYIFVKIEADYVVNGTKTSALYHLGDNSFYSELNQDKAFSIYEGQIHSKKIRFNLDAFFEDIDLNTQENTHTVGNFSVAEDLMNKFVNAVSIQ